MFVIRRMLTVVGLTGAVTASASVPAWAAFADSAKVSTTIATTTVAAPASVTVNDYCVTTTTTVTDTYAINPGNGYSTLMSSSTSTSTAVSTSNVQGTTTSTVPGAANTSTTTTVTKNTDLHVTASWTASGSRGVNGYGVTAHLVDGTAYPMAQTTAGTLSTSQTVDADNLAYQPRLSVTTLTNYGWTAQSALTGYISC